MSGSRRVCKPLVTVVYLAHRVIRKNKEIQMWCEDDEGNAGARRYFNFK